MVRVISVHHFTNQHVHTVEQPTASAVAPPNRLLLALSSHCIEVRDLNDYAEVLFTFPTVDEVTQIVHCLNGDYVATMETKYNRQNRETNFVRVYVNWDNIATMQQSKMTHSGVSLGSSECGMVQPMRARIAGRVTPTTNQSELGSLEMIEIPVKRNPQQIQCCQITGNIIIQMNKSIMIYTFEVKTHDISRLKFIDFEEGPLTIDLSFYPRDIAICENYMACSNNDTLHMFRIINKRNKEDQSNGEQNCEYNFNYNQDDTTIDYKKLLKNEKLKNNKDKFTIHLPSIVKENSIIYKYCPFTFSDRDIKATIKYTSSIELKNYQIENLIQLKLRPIVVELSQKQVTEEFKCMLLKPLYINQNLAKKQNDSDNANILRSNHRNLLHSVVCVITTQQEGYLYQFTDSDLHKSVDSCISVYPFTAPIFKIVMEDYFLHALTETGLESYTLRNCHQLCRHLEVVDDENVACPPVQESICLMGLRPFLGVEEILLSDNHLILLANADSSPTHSVSSHGSSTATYWTLYKLELPTPKNVFNDISIVANTHRFTSIQTYCHLMNEAHMILRTALILTKWSMTEGNVSVVTTKKTNNEDLKEAYRTSCALLGDHFVMCSSEREYVLCVPYYRMGLIYPSEVLNRVKKVQEQSNNFSTKGLLYYLKTVLLDAKYGPDADKYYISGSKQNFSETIIELFQKHCFDDLPNIVLKSNILREYTTDKLITVLHSGTCKNSKNQSERLLALVMLYVQRCNLKKAQDILVDIPKEELSSILLQNWDLLFDQMPISGKPKAASFSELCVLLMSVYTEILSDIFVTLVIEKKVITLHKMLKIFLEYLPASIGSDGTTGSKILQITLEKYFLAYFTKYDSVELTKLTLDRATNEAMKLLVRSYLSQLQIMQLKEKKVQKGCEEKNVIDENTKEEFGDKKQPYFEENNIKNEKDTYLFSNYRHEYLDKMPPFQMEITSKLYEASVKNFCSREIVLENKEADVILKKLQAVLSSPIISKQVVVEVIAFLDLNEDLRGCLSIQSIILNINEAVNLLIDKCPQCLLQFGKDKFSKNDEWKYMIATIQSRIIRLSENVDLKHVCFFYKKILRDVLTHVATTMNLEQLLDVFPQKMNVTNLDHDKKIDSNKAESLDDALQFDPFPTFDDLESVLKSSNMEIKDGEQILNEIQNYEPYITICKETMHANQIKKLITATGQQLLYLDAIINNIRLRSQLNRKATK